MLCRSGGCLVNDGSEACASSFRNYDSVCTDALRASNNCTEIMRVADLITDNNERSFIALLRKSKDIVNGAVVPDGAQRNNP